MKMRLKTQDNTYFICSAHETQDPGTTPGGLGRGTLLLSVGASRPLSPSPYKRTAMPGRAYSRAHGRAMPRGGGAPQSRSMLRSMTSSASR